MGKAGGTVKGRRARPRKWAQQVVAGRAGMRRDDESVTHGVAPRMLILPPQTLPPLFTWMSHIPFPTVLCFPFFLSPLDSTNPSITYSISSREGKNREEEENTWIDTDREISVLTEAIFAEQRFEGTKEIIRAHRIPHVTSRFRVKISFIRFLFLFFLFLNPSSGLSDPMIHGNSNSSRPASFTGSISSENREPISSSFSFHVLLTFAEIQIQDLFQTSV